MSHPGLAGTAALTGVVLLLSACGGGSKSATPTAVSATPQASASTTPGGSSTAVTSRATAAATTVAASPTPGAPAAVASPPPSAKVFNAENAKTIVDQTAILPPELPSGWKVQTDTTADNAAAAVTDPKASASFERCGRLIGRTVRNLPFDAVSAFLAGETLSYFSSVTVYATDAGAADCSDETRVRLSQPGELARALGPLFINPDAVVIALVPPPAEISGSFAATLTGQINAAGTTIDLTVLLVSFRRGGITAVVGSARSGQDPPLAELLPYAKTMLQRVTTFTN